ncbi:MAG: trehalose-phosphatase [Candidatus Heimdallarchaeota archaeon]|nr:trehalose-phosphatase [Candidatus Heimdallarchaeota archaeon]
MAEYSYDAVIFDMDGVITKTALVHSQAWKLVFDEYLRSRSKENGEDFEEFTYERDYLTYVDGKPRLKGIQSFLESRGIIFPLGTPEDGADVQTVYSIGNQKNAKFRHVLETDGVEVYDSTISLIKELRAKGFKTGVVSSSKNCQFVLESAGVLDLFDTRVDGIIAVERNLEGKPEGDIFVEAATELGTTPCRSVVIEDAISGVQSGRNGGFGLVIGVARSDNVDELNKNGADVVVTDLEPITLAWMETWFNKPPVSLFDCWDNAEKVKQGYSSVEATGITINPIYFYTPKDIFSRQNKPVFFLDYDGTLTPIVDRPELAVISQQMKDTVANTAKKFTTAIVSGRMREDVENLVGIDGLFYVGSHGFDILGGGVSMIQAQAQQTIPVVTDVIEWLKKEVGSIEGVIIEEKKFSTAVHYRLVADENLEKIEKAVLHVIENHKELHLMRGKMVYEILPNIDWNKGKAVRWIMKALNISWDNSMIVYVGDDTTDEFAFRAVRGLGIGILVSDKSGPSAAQYQLSTPDEVLKLFEKLLKN